MSIFFKEDCGRLTIQGVKEIKSTLGLMGISKARYSVINSLFTCRVKKSTMNEDYSTPGMLARAIKDTVGTSFEIEVIEWYENKYGNLVVKFYVRGG